MATLSANTLLDPVGTLTASIQAQVGRFLQLKAKLLPLTVSTDPATAQAANQYMQQQVQLEGQLPQVLAIANTLTPSTILTANGVNVAAFGTAMMQHIQAVESFVGPANVTVANQALLPGLGLTNTQFLIGLGIIGAGIALGKPLIGAMVAAGGYVYAKS